MLLRYQSYMVEELTEKLGIRQPNVTRHLIVLQRAGFIVGKRKGMCVYFSLTPKARICAWLWQHCKNDILE